MIRHGWTRAELEEALERRLGSRKNVQSWLSRAAALNATALESNALDEKTIWAEVKVALLDLQRGKCAYCEKPVEWAPDGDFVGKGVTDVEHYRPKGRVEPWAPASERGRYEVRGGRATGYPELAHDLDNYAVACKPCNSDLKHDHFPIAGRLKKRGSTIEAIDESERPYLLFPVGPRADDPTEHLVFDGLLCRPANGGVSRGRVTIDLLRLDDREDLVMGRAFVVFHMFAALELVRLAPSAEERGEAAANVEAYCDDSYPFAATARAFRAQYEGDRVSARDLHARCRDLVRSRDPSLL